MHFIITQFYIILTEDRQILIMSDQLKFIKKGHFDTHIGHEIYLIDKMNLLISVTFHGAY